MVYSYETYVVEPCPLTLLTVAVVTSPCPPSASRRRACRSKSPYRPVGTARRRRKYQPPTGEITNVPLDSRVQHRDFVSGHLNQTSPSTTRLYRAHPKT